MCKGVSVGKNIFRTIHIMLWSSFEMLHNSDGPQCTVKPAYVVTSIKGLPVLSSLIFWAP